MPSWDFARDPTATSILVDVGTEHGLSAADCLQGTGLTTAALADPATVVEAGQELQVARNLVGRLGDGAGLGTVAGRRHSLAKMGIWGFVVITSPTVGEALQTALRYSRLSSAFVRPELTTSGGQIRMVLRDDEIPEDVRAFLVARDLAAVGAMLPEILPGFAVDLGADALVADAALLARPMPRADSTTRAAVEAACERLLESRQHRAGVASRVRARLLERPDAMPSLAELAVELHLDVRTLRRHLAAEQTSYRQLREEVALGLATELLQTVGLSVGETADRLGYADATAFAHAFKRWTGRAPSTVRRA